MARQPKMKMVEGWYDCACVTCVLYLQLDTTEDLLDTGRHLEDTRVFQWCSARPGFTAKDVLVITMCSVGTSSCLAAAKCTID